MDDRDRPSPRGVRAGCPGGAGRGCAPGRGRSADSCPRSGSSAGPDAGASGSHRPGQHGDPGPGAPACHGPAAGDGRAVSPGDGNWTSHLAATCGAGADGRSGPGGAVAALDRAPEGSRRDAADAASHAARDRAGGRHDPHARGAGELGQPRREHGGRHSAAAARGRGWEARGREAALSALATLLVACGGSAPAPSHPAVHPIDEATAEQGARGLLGEIAGAIDRDDTDGVMTLLSDPFVVFGPRRTDVLPTRADALVALKALVDPLTKRHAPVRAGDFDVVASPGGHSAWSIDVVQVAGEPLAVTAILSNADDIWLLSAVALARTPPAGQLKADLARQAVVPAGMASIGKVDAAARGAADLFEHGLADQTLWGDDLAHRSDAVVVGPALGEVARGKAAITKLWKRRLKAHTREAPAGLTTAFATADGQLAWVTAPVVRFADDSPPLPVRAFAVFVKRDGTWHMRALQEAVALAEPGAGAPYAKVQPPALPAPPAPPPAPAKPAPKKTHHHHHHHTESTDDR